jgi:hypothetical protein
MLVLTTAKGIILPQPDDKLKTVFNSATMDKDKGVNG